MHKLCIWHTMENIKKIGRKHSGELREGVLAEVLRLFKASAYTAKQEVSSCDAKEQAYIFIQRGWSFARTMDARERRYGRTWQNQVEYLFLSFTRTLSRPIVFCFPVRAFNICCFGRISCTRKRSSSVCCPRRARCTTTWKETSSAQGTNDCRMRPARSGVSRGH